MTDEMMDLRMLVEKAPDADIWREMIAFAGVRPDPLPLTGHAKRAVHACRSLRRLSSAGQDRPPCAPH